MCYSPPPSLTAKQLELGLLAMQKIWAVCSGQFSTATKNPKERKSKNMLDWSVQLKGVSEDNPCGRAWRAISKRGSCICVDGKISREVCSQITSLRTNP